MYKVELTARQRRTLECVEGARTAGMTLSAYAQSRGLPVREVYDALGPLRKKGLLPAAHATKSAFMAVRVVRGRRAQGAAVAPASAPSSAPRLVCRIVHGAGLMVECAEWPPTAWLIDLSSGRADAAP
jgi:hypothetical protein